MSVEHDGQVLVHGQHLSQWILREEFVGATSLQQVTERPVGVVGMHQCVSQPRLLLRIQLLATEISAKYNMSPL